MTVHEGGSKIALTEYRVVIVHPCVTVYRVPFFARLCTQLGASMQLYASPGTLGAITQPKTVGPWETRLGPIRGIGFGLMWQTGALGVRLRRGDVLVVSGAPRCVTNLLLLVKARLYGVPVVWWGHFRSATSRSWAMRLRLIMARAAHVLLFYTDHEVNAYLSMIGRRERQPVLALNNGLDTTIIRQSRQPYLVADRLPRVLFLGRITAKADLGLLIRGLAEPGCPNVLLHVIGDGPAKNECCALAACLGVGDRIVWHGAVFDETLIAEIANRCAHHGLSRSRRAESHPRSGLWPAGDGSRRGKRAYARDCGVQER